MEFACIFDIFDNLFIRFLESHGSYNVLKYVGQNFLGLLARFHHFICTNLAQNFIKGATNTVFDRVGIATHFRADIVVEYGRVNKSHVCFLVCLFVCLCEWHEVDGIEIP